jgi:hypothetical protein
MCPCRDSTVYLVDLERAKKDQKITKLEKDKKTFEKDNERLRAEVNRLTQFLTDTITAKRAIEEQLKQCSCSASKRAKMDEESPMDAAVSLASMIDDGSDPTQP